MTWLVVLAVGIGSYLLRALPLWVDERWVTSPRIERVISHAGTAALAALIAAGLRPQVLASDGSLATIAAAVAALVVAVRGMSMLRVLFAGAAAFALFWGVTSLIS